LVPRKMDPGPWSKVGLNVHTSTSSFVPQVMRKIQYPPERDASIITVMLCKRTETGGSLIANCFQNKNRRLWNKSTILQIWKRCQYSNSDALSRHWDRRFSDCKNLPMIEPEVMRKIRYPSKHWSKISSSYLLLLWKEPAERGFLSGSLAQRLVSVCQGDAIVAAKIPKFAPICAPICTPFVRRRMVFWTQCLLWSKSCVFWFQRFQKSSVQCSACDSVRFSPLLASVVCLGSPRNEGSRCSNGKG
jgi:hypothetical protein